MHWDHIIPRIVIQNIVELDCHGTFIGCHNGKAFAYSCVAGGIICYLGCTVLDIGVIDYITEIVVALWLCRRYPISVLREKES